MYGIPKIKYDQPYYKATLERISNENIIEKLFQYKFEKGYLPKQINLRVIFPQHLKEINLNEFSNNFKIIRETNILKITPLNHLRIKILDAFRIGIDKDLKQMRLNT